LKGKVGFEPDTVQVFVKERKTSGRQSDRIRQGASNISCIRTRRPSCPSVVKCEIVTVFGKWGPRPEMKSKASISDVGLLIGEVWTSTRIDVASAEKLKITTKKLKLKANANCVGEHVVPPFPRY
jgi:hypothetical protein